jgi:hypothetical protein
MRHLSIQEIGLVSGACCECHPTPPCHPVPPCFAGGKGNNGFGNGSDYPNLAAPGNSGSTGGGKAGSVGDARGPR